MAAELAELRSRLEVIAEELADLAIDRLREAVSAGAESAPGEERRLTRARRSVEKAVALLADDPSSDDG